LLFRGLISYFSDLKGSSLIALGGFVDPDLDPLECLHLLRHQLLHWLQLGRMGLSGQIFKKLGNIEKEQV
jgi:hypothetical protein